MELLSLDILTEHVGTRSGLLARVDHALDDVVMLDWLVCQEGTPALVREMLDRNPKLRIVTVLPAGLRQYRKECWQAGACTGIAKEYMEQEWLSSVLCIMHRAMERHSAALLYLNDRGHWSAAFTPPFDLPKLRQDLATLMASGY